MGLTMKEKIRNIEILLAVIEILRKGKSEDVKHRLVYLGKTNLFVDIAENGIGERL